MIFHNPVRVERGTPDFAWLPSVLGARRAALVTTAGMESRGVIDRLLEALGQQSLPGTRSVKSNPTVASIRQNAAELLDTRRDPEVLLAVGGGSTIDTAKGIAAIASGGFAGDWFSSHLRDGAPFPESFQPPSIIAVPSTAGTGSEVTMWGTVWDEETGAKYSISHPRLYPEWAILVPELTFSVPPDLMLFTALDALSHCLESMWNRRSNAVSDAFAAAGLSLLARTIGPALQKPDDSSLRERLQEGALLGGLAISQTATALAHSISYPLTSRLGMPHGLACSFTLPEVMRFNSAAGGRAPIATALAASDENEAADTLSRFFSAWNVTRHVAKYLDEQRARGLQGSLLTPGRAANNVRDATEDDALGIVLRSL